MGSGDSNPYSGFDWLILGFAIGVFFSLLVCWAISRYDLRKLRRKYYLLTREEEEVAKAFRDWKSDAST